MRVNNRIVGAGLMLALAGTAAAAEPIMTKAGALPTPPAGMGQVVFFRPGSMFGVALGCTVHEGEPEIARLGSGKYYIVTEAPGKHDFSTRGGGADKLTVEVESGETYFVKCNIAMGMMSGGANLSPSDEAGFAKKAKGLNLWKGPKADVVAAVK